MKHLLLTAALLATIPAAAAHANNTAAPTTEQIEQACNEYARVAEIVITYRQDDIPIQEVIASFDKVEDLPPSEKQNIIQMTEMAYTADIQDNLEDRVDIIKHFRNAIHESCTNDLSSRS